MYPIQQKESWPVRLAMKAGAKDKVQATKIVLAVSVLLIISAIIIYSRSTSNPSAEEIDPIILMEMEALNAR
jgi:hypothetical protein